MLYHNLPQKVIIAKSIRLVSGNPHVELALAHAEVLADNVELLLLAVLLPHDAELPEPARVEVCPRARRPGKEDELHPEDVRPLRLGVPALDVHLVLYHLEGEIGGVAHKILFQITGFVFV